MRLGELLGRIPGARLDGDPASEVSRITHDSRLGTPECLFAALPGQKSHGLDHLQQALERGAHAVLSDRPRPSAATVPWLTSDRPRHDMAVAAWALAGDPQRDLLMVGITGTNGKSTTAHLISGILEAAGVPTGLFGTLGYRLPDGEVPAERTTPEATDLAPLLARVPRGGATVMEVSSHALVLERVAGLAFQVAVWTNLTRDHLDFHGDMESYFVAKRRLFTEHLATDGRRVLPIEEESGRRLLSEARAGDLSWGVNAGDVRAAAVTSSLAGTSFTLLLPAAEVAVKLPLVGAHNLRNALAAAAAAHAAGLPAAVIRDGLEAARPVPGRLEPVQTELSFPVFVDFAHTPEGLRSVLESLRAVTDRRLIVVFGAGGDRDTGKRGPMGRAVGAVADLAIVTSDNPRSEDPAAIAAAVAAGVRAAGSEPTVILDRRQAIAHALAAADDASVVVVAGKGHERIQLVGDSRIPFCDVAVTRALAREATCS